jgi:hypothetical protein
MKLIQTVFVAALLVAAAPAALAAGQAPDLGAEAEAPAAEAPVDLSFLDAPAAGCEAEAGAALAVDDPEGSPVALSCGACSSANCQGANRGQICHLGIGGGWGHCNIYSGGYLCPSGGWECDCASGPLP